MSALDVNRTHDIFSFHLAKLPFFKIPPFLWTTKRDPYGAGLLHAESFLAMNLGEPVLSSSRFDFQSVGFFAWWQHEAALDHFLSHPSKRFLHQGWHVRMRLYRRWGFISELKDACVNPTLYQEGQPVVAVTLARLKLLQTSRFIRWGRPVEQQVRDHDRQTLALAGFRPFHTFSTLSIWKSERDMIRMVHGVDQEKDGTSHALAMQERERKDFHHEFTTMRFVPFHEEGKWKGL